MSKSNELERTVATAKIEADVKRAMVAECIKHGITNYEDVINVCLDAADGIGEMTVPAYKAWQTMNARNAKKIKNRLTIINRRKIR